MAEHAADSADAGAETGAPVRPADGSTPCTIDDAVRELARREAVVEAGDAAAVGAFLDVYFDGENAVTARFLATVEGYVGWQWSVTLAVVGTADATVSEVVLLPGPEALLAPAWVPWGERVRPGDLGVGDLLPPPPDDDRIVPAYVQSDDPAVEDLATEIGLGRVRVLSRQGRIDAAARWHGGDFGPGDEMAKHAPAACATCAFFVPIAGSLGQGFGVCTNEFSPADGHVVDAAYGCGAHSEATIDRAPASWAADTVVDELRMEVYRHASPDESAEGATEPAGAEPAETVDAVDGAVTESDTAESDAAESAAQEDTAVVPQGDESGHADTGDVTVHAAIDDDNPHDASLEAGVGGEGPVI